MKKNRGYTTVELLVVFFYFIVLPLAVFGWGWNIWKIAHGDFVLSGMLILRVIGVFVAPLGSILGYC